MKSNQKSFKNINEYFSTVPKDVRIKLQQIRETIHKVAPKAEEVISYNMPAFRQKNVLVYFAAFKDHIGFFPTSKPIIVFKKELEGYKTSKGTIQFPLDKKIPRGLISKITKYRVKEIEGKEKSSGTIKGKASKETGKEKSKSSFIKAGGVDEYIANCPLDVQIKLNEIRSTIRSAAPKSTETVSYFEIPGYSYEGYDYNGMFAWFSFKKPYVRLHLRPPVIEDHKKELANYITTKAIVSLPQDEKIPASLVKKLVKASVKAMKDKSAIQTN